MPLEPLKDTGGPLATVRGAAIVALGFGTLLPLNLLQLLSLILRPFSRSAFRRVNRWCADTWWGWCVICAERVYGVRVITTGDEVPMHENAILVSNHQQMPDITTLMSFARTKDRLGDLKFFVKKQLKWVPGMGWGMQFLDCLYVDRDWASDRAQIQKTFASLVEGKVPVFLVSFAEGTRLTLPKLEAARAYAREHGLNLPRHTLIPRSRGFAASVEGLRTHIDAVYDLTIGYEGAIPTLWQYIKGMVQRIHLHVRRFPVAELPESTEDLRRWLMTRWEEKDQLLEHFYETGTFPKSLER